MKILFERISDLVAITPALKRSFGERVSIVVMVIGGLTLVGLLIYALVLH